MKSQIEKSKLGCRIDCRGNPDQSVKKFAGFRRTSFSNSAEHIRETVKKSLFCPIRLEKNGIAIRLPYIPDILISKNI